MVFIENGHIYVTVNDLRNVVNKNTLLSNLSRNSAESVFLSGDTYPKYYNIANPYRKTRTDSKRAVMFNTIPADVQEKVLEKLGIAGKNIEAALQEQQQTNPNRLTETAINAVQKAIEISAVYVRVDALSYIDKHSERFVSFYTEINLPYLQVIAYSRTCAFAEWLCLQHDRITELNLSNKDYKRWRHSLHITVVTVVTEAETEFNIKVPKSERRFGDWFANLISEYQMGKTPEEIIKVRNRNNKNTQKLTELQQHIAAYLYLDYNLNAKQVYEKMLDLAVKKDWWVDRETGAFKPVSYVTIANFIKENENSLMFFRKGYVKYYNNYVPTITRNNGALEKNQIWVIDGTPHDENVQIKYKDGRSKTYQSVYQVSVYDQATYKHLGISIAPQKQRQKDNEQTESFEVTVEAVKMAIRNSGHKPAVLQSDHGPAYSKLKEWCKENGIKLIPAGKGHARSKIVEMLLGHKGNLILRTLEGWSGQNLTAQGRSSHPAPAKLKEGWKNARNFGEVIEWLQNEAIDLWNNHIIETMDKKPLGKTPNELWEEKESYTVPLDRMRIAMIAGSHHQRKLENEGLRVQKDRIHYTYFPPVRTDAERKKAVQIFAKIPRNARTTNRLNIYVLEYGQPAYVFDHSGKKYLGEWLLKEETIATETLQETVSDAYKDYRKLQLDVVKDAKDFTKKVMNIGKSEHSKEVQEVGAEPLTGKKRNVKKEKYTDIYDKESCNLDELWGKGLQDFEQDVQKEKEKIEENKSDTEHGLDTWIN